ncbi:MAG: hypothetical protein LW808_002085 [Verrucomicrobiota bacterium]|nr:MAG: hypothetical protein LW808_002085 [Verrucomicrobiota bacterium]
MSVSGASNTNWGTYKFRRSEAFGPSYDIDKRDAAKIVVELAKLGDKSAQALAGKGPFAAIRLCSAIKNGKLIQDKQGQEIAIGQAVQNLLDELPLEAFKTKAFSKTRWKMNKSVLRTTFQSKGLESINKFHELKQEFEALRRQKETKEAQLDAKFGKEWKKLLPEKQYIEANGRKFSYATAIGSGATYFASPYERRYVYKSYTDKERFNAMDAMNTATQLLINQYDDLLNSQTTPEINTSGPQQITNEETTLQNNGEPPLWVGGEIDPEIFDPLIQDQEQGCSEEYFEGRLMEKTSENTAETLQDKSISDDQNYSRRGFASTDIKEEIAKPEKPVTLESGKTETPETEKQQMAAEKLSIKDKIRLFDGGTSNA